MKQLILILLITNFISGCTSTNSANTNNCIEVANKAENNGNKSGDDLFKECLAKQHQKEDAKKGFWENSLEGLLFFVLDMTTS